MKPCRYSSHCRLPCSPRTRIAQGIGADIDKVYFWQQGVYRQRADGISIMRPRTPVRGPHFPARQVPSISSSVLTTSPTVATNGTKDLDPAQGARPDYAL